MFYSPLYRNLYMVTSFFWYAHATSLSHLINIHLLHLPNHSISPNFFISFRHQFFLQFNYNPSWHCHMSLMLTFPRKILFLPKKRIYSRSLVIPYDPIFSIPLQLDHSTDHPHPPWHLKVCQSTQLPFCCPSFYWLLFFHQSLGGLSGVTLLASQYSQFDSESGSSSNNGSLQEMWNLKLYPKPTESGNILNRILRWVLHRLKCGKCCPSHLLLLFSISLHMPPLMPIPSRVTSNPFISSQNISSMFYPHNSCWLLSISSIWQQNHRHNISRIPFPHNPPFWKASSLKSSPCL